MGRPRRPSRPHGRGRVADYDALLLAVGARTEVPFEHVTVFDDAHADDTYRGVVQDIEEGYTQRVALLLPDGPAWPLPIYELALMTAQRADSMWMDELGVDIVTPEPEPLAAFGEGASRAVGELLEAARVRVHVSSRAEVPASRKLVVQPEGRELEPGRIVALPRLEGPRIRAVPADQRRLHSRRRACRVRGLEPRVFAAGDAADLQIKHGGLGAQMADAAAAGSRRWPVPKCRSNRCGRCSAVSSTPVPSRSTSRRGSRTGTWSPRCPRPALARRREGRGRGARPVPALARLSRS